MIDRTVTLAAGTQTSRIGKDKPPCPEKLNTVTRLARLENDRRRTNLTSCQRSSHGEEGARPEPREVSGSEQIEHSKFH